GHGERAADDEAEIARAGRADRAALRLRRERLQYRLRLLPFLGERNAERTEKLVARGAGADVALGKRGEEIDCVTMGEVEQVLVVNLHRSDCTPPSVTIGL